MSVSESCPWAAAVAPRGGGRQDGELHRKPSGEPANLRHPSTGSMELLRS